MAIRIHNLLANGMGGLDWSGLEILVAKFGVEDVDALIERLEVIKKYDPKADDPPPPAEPPPLAEQ